MPDALSFMTFTHERAEWIPEAGAELLASRRMDKSNLDFSKLTATWMTTSVLGNTKRINLISLDGSMSSVSTHAPTSFLVTLLALVHSISEFPSPVILSCIVQKNPLSASEIIIATTTGGTCPALC